MMSLPALLLALAIPTLEGALLLCILEGRYPQLLRTERILAGFLVGVPLSSELLFFAVLFQFLPLTLTGFAIGHGVLLVLLLAFFFWRFHAKDGKFSIFPTGTFGNSQFSIPRSPRLSLPSIREIRASLPPWLFALLCVLFAWLLLKLGAAIADLLTTPAYFDDVYANWNARAKVLYLKQDLLLDLPRAHELFFGGRVPNYPLGIYFGKIWLAMVTGGLAPHPSTSTALGTGFASGAGWSEWAVNSLNAFYLLTLLGLLFYALLRRTSLPWGIAGIALLLSLPLFLMHSASAYSDIALSASIFFTLTLFLRFLEEEDVQCRRTLLLLIGVSAAAMAFLKSEGALLYLPPLLLFLALREFVRKRSWHGILPVLLPFVSITLGGVLPWIIFKMVRGLEFGNSQSLSGLSLSPNSDVLPAIASDLLYTGSYLLFFPFFAFLIVLSWRHLRRSSIGVLLLYFGVIFLGQFLLFFLTSLALEAIRHTGFGRGIVQMLPSLVFIATVLLHILVRELWKTGGEKTIAV